MLDAKPIRSTEKYYFAIFASVAVVAVVCGIVVLQHRTDKAYRLQIADRCNAVISAIERADDIAAEGTYLELDRLVRNRNAHSASVEAQLENVQNRFAPVAQRLAQSRANRQRTQALEDLKKRASVSKSSHKVPRAGADLATAVDETESRLVGKVIRGETDYSDVRQDVNALKAEAQSLVNSMNRRPGELGYSIEQRREAAIKMLIANGESPSDARETVQLMEERGLLPDPPRK